MNASLNNAGLELIGESISTIPAPRSSPQPDASGHEALQALLAFSALHEQIRNRRARQMRDGVITEDNWKLEQFVLDEVLQLVAERALAITGADGVAVALAEGDAIVCRASAGTIAPDAGMRLDPNSGFSGECLVSGRIVRCDDTETDSRVDLRACQRLGVRSLLAVPLSAKQSVIGLLEAFSNEPYGFNDSDVRSLNLLSELVLSALKPEEEDRLTEISQRVVGEKQVEPTFSPDISTEQFAGKVEVVAAPEEAVKEQLAASLKRCPDTNEAFSANRETAASIRSASENAEVQPDPQSLEDGWVDRPIESGLELAAQEDSKPMSHSASLGDKKETDHSLPGLGVVVAVVMFAVGLGIGTWWMLGHRPRPTATSSAESAPAASPTAPAVSVPTEPTSALTAANEVAEDASESEPTSAAEAGVLPKITGIRHWSSADSSTVVIDIQDQVQYEAHRLPKPERIYFDLHDTTLAPDLLNRTIAVNDALLEKLRVAQPMAGVTRVVLETKGPSDFSVSLESNPFRLVVEVRKPGTRPRARAKVDLFAPSDSASVGEAKQTTANQKALTVPGSLQPNQAGSQMPSGNDGKGLATSSTPQQTAATPTPVLTPKLRVVLDAGHGGWDLGGVGRNGLYEKDLVLDIVQRLGHLVESRLGAEVVYTRKDDSYLALEKRAEIANLAQANLFLSVHANYSDYPSARGVETYYTNTYSSVRARTEDADDAAPAGLKTINWTNVDIRAKVHESRRVAASVQRALYATLAAKNPGLPNRGVKEAHYVVLTGTSMPAILAEVSFVSSPTDENNLQSSTYRQQIAEALYSGIARYQAANHEVKIAKAAPKSSGR